MIKRKAHNNNIQTEKPNRNKQNRILQTKSNQLNVQP